MFGGVGHARDLWEQMAHWSILVKELFNLSYIILNFQAISTILDKQSMLFVDTADMLARMSRETLVKARWVKAYL